LPSASSDVESVELIAQQSHETASTQDRPDLLGRGHHQNARYWIAYLEE
jgi:hypothetical protein